ncbi:Hypothetical protein PBC10988_19850 [Planctomycetales bacterium 10988]|nr:Hypothetical protein PBC10988_19850 [Planctomycetales bacterium 10988]
MDEFSRIQFFLERKRYQEAVREAHKILHYDPHNGAIHAILGLTFLEQRQYQAAKEAIRRAIYEEPELAFGYYVMAHYQMTHLKDRKAEKAIRHALYLDPLCSSYHHLHGIILLRRSQIELAIGAFRQAIRFDPTETSNFTLLSVAYLCAKDTRKMRKVLDHALQLFPDDRNILSMIAEIALVQGRWAEAEDLFQGLLSRQPESCHFRRGLLLARNKRPSIARWRAIYVHSMPRNRSLRAKCYAWFLQALQSLETLSLFPFLFTKARRYLNLQEKICIVYNFLLYLFLFISIYLGFTFSAIFAIGAIPLICVSMLTINGIMFPELLESQQFCLRIFHGNQSVYLILYLVLLFFAFYFHVHELNVKEDLGIVFVGIVFTLFYMGVLCLALNTCALFALFDPIDTSEKKED